jgi:DNA invertase Pin-like site-specific DNA recombinase
MPPTFRGSGRASRDHQRMTLATQQAMVTAHYEYGLLTGNLPKGTIWGGFVADPATCRDNRLMHRPGGKAVIEASKKGDYICGASFDRLFGSTLDCYETIDWAKHKGVHIVIMNLNLDTSTPAGRMFMEIMGAMKAFEREEIIRRIKEDKAYRKSAGIPYSAAPVGYVIKKIVTPDGRKMKHYFPDLAQRKYANLIIAMHDEQGLSFKEIGLKLLQMGVKKPTSGKINPDPMDAYRWYKRAKDGWLLPGGLQWKAPDFRFKYEGKSEYVDLIAECA